MRARVRAEYAEGRRSPLVIGITGYRNLLSKDEGRLRNLVAKFFRSEFKRKYAKTPLILLTLLREGAERLVASLALELGIELVVLRAKGQETGSGGLDPLSSEASRLEYERLLSRAKYSIALPEDAAETPGDADEPGDGPGHRERRVGAYIAHRCHVLLVIWDGSRARERGPGPAEVAGMKTKCAFGRARSGVDSQLQPADGGVVYYILRAVAWDASRSPSRFVTGWLFSHSDETLESIAELASGGGRSPVGLDEWRSGREVRRQRRDGLRAERRVWRHIDRLNGDTSLFDRYPRSRLAAAVPKLERELVCLAPGSVGTFYILVSCLARLYKSRSRRTLPLLFLFAFLAAAFFNVSYRRPDQRWATRAYVVTLSIGFTVFWWARAREYQRKYLDYRALAESLRMQLFWRTAGLDCSVADYYWRPQRSDLGWVRYVIRYWDLVAERDVPRPELARGMLQVQEWVSCQVQYFATAALYDQRLLAYLNYLAWPSLIAGAAWIVVRGVLGSMAGVGWITLRASSWWVRILSLTPGEVSALEFVGIGIGLGSVAGGLLFGYARAAALAEHVSQYRRMGILFERAQQQLKRLIVCADRAKVKELVVDLVRETLVENGDWVRIHRDRPLQMPRG